MKKKKDSEGVISIYLTDVDLTYICTLCVTNKYRKKGIGLKVFLFLIIEYRYFNSEHNAERNNSIG